MSRFSFQPARRRLLKGAGAVWLLGISRIGLAAGNHVVAVRIWPASTYSRVTIESTAPLSYNQFILTSPPRLVVDINNIELNKVIQQAPALAHKSDPYISKVRVGQFNRETVRLVLELRQPVSPHIFTLKPVAGIKNRLVLDLYPVRRTQNDPLLALLEDYNNGLLEKEQPYVAPLPGRAGKDRAIIIMIDPGHGGEDPGALGKMKTREKDIVLNIGRHLKALIDKEPAMRAFMTRNEDVFIPLGVRVAKARKQRADLFVSIHADAFSNPNASGSSVFALSTHGATSAAARFLAQTQNESDLIGGVSRSGDRYLDRTMFEMAQSRTVSDSLIFGEQVLSHMGKINRLHKHTVDQAGFAVLKAPDIPSILVETAFISNPSEERKLRTRRYQQQVARAILKGIKAYFAKGAVLAR